MSWRDALAFGWRDLRRRPGRAVVAVVAIALATGLACALVAVAGTAEDRVAERLGGEARAGLLVTAPDVTASTGAIPGSGGALDTGAMQSLSAVPGVRGVLAVETAGVSVVATRAPDGSPPAGGARPAALVGMDMGADAGGLPVALVAGRVPSAGSSSEVAVDTDLLDQMGFDRRRPTEALGAELLVGAGRVGEPSGAVFGRWSRLSVVGVVAQDVAPGALLVDRPGVAAAKAWTWGEGAAPYEALWVLADSADTLRQVRDEAGARGLVAREPASAAGTLSRYVRTIRTVLGAVGLAGVVIAGLGVADAMFAAVRERRREFAVMKAVGARDGDVRRLVLVEGWLLGLAGGVVGAALGLAVTWMVELAVDRALADLGAAGVRLGFGGREAAVGLLAATFLAVGAATVPAWRAATAPPREAMDT